jgi:hypothetical protein
MNKKQTSQIEVPVSDELAAKLKAWRQANPRATLTEIEEAVEAELAKVRKELVTELARAGDGQERPQEAAPEEQRGTDAAIRATAVALSGVRDNAFSPWMKR